MRTIPTGMGLLLVCLVLSACGSALSSGEGSDQFLNYDGMVEEFKNTQVELGYPDSAEKSSPPPRGDSGMFQEGWGASLATQDWNCAWGERWLEVNGADETAAAEAFEMYSAIVDTPAFKTNFDPSLQDHIRDIIEKARLGDIAELREDIEANCRS